MTNHQEEILVVANWLSLVTGISAAQIIWDTWQVYAPLWENVKKVFAIDPEETFG